MQVFQAHTNFLQDQDSQASLKMMVISNLCWKQWGRKRRRQTDESQGTIPSTSNVWAERGMQKALGVKVRGPAVVREQQRGSASW